MYVNRIIPWEINRFIAATALIAVGAALRIWPLHSLGSILVWLTFYPAVTVSAVYGGFSAGLLATVLSCLAAIFLGPLLVGEHFITAPADWLGLAIYFLNCMLISIVAEAMRRANARAKKAQGQTEELLRESKMRFRATFEQAAVGIAHVAPDGRWLDVNQRLCDIVGYTREELLEIRFQDITHPDDLEPDLGYMRQLLAGEIPNFSMEKRYLKKSGDIVWVNLTAALVRRPDSDPDYFISVVEDITERRRAEEKQQESERKYRQLTEQASEGIFVVDQKGRYLDVNPAGLEMVGYGLEELRGMTIPDLMPPDELKKAPSRFPEILSGKTIISERMLKRKDGSLFQAEITAKLMSDGNVLATKRDITERKRSEKALIAAKEEAERSNKAKSVFLSSMSHEIRTPLTSVIGFSHLLATDTEHPLNDFQKNLLDKVVDSGNKLLELINSALDLARIESGVIEVSIEAVEMISLAATALTSSARLAKEHGVRLGSKPASVDCYVMADSALLSQVVTGLLSNAIKYNKNGGETILAWKLSNENKVRISVSDEGPGISEDNIKNLYTPFDRLGMEGRNIQGFGVGLAIVKRLVELMGGEVGVESEVGEGSTFYIVLPAGKKP